MKIIASIVFSIIVAFFAVKANNDRLQEVNVEILSEKAKDDARQSVREEVAAMQVDRLEKQVSGRERIIRLSTNPAEQALAIEDLRESRAELRRYQSQLSR